MSRIISILNTSSDDLKKLSKNLTVTIPPSRYSMTSVGQTLRLYDVVGGGLAEEPGLIYVPFAYDIKIPRPARETFRPLEAEFKGQLRPEQVEVRDEALRRLNSHGSVIIAAACGFGKTAISINLAAKIRLTTLIICTRIILLNQWEESLQKFCPQASYQTLQPAKKIQEVDFYLINAINVPKFTREFYSNIGCVIVDEAHLIMASKLSQCMRYLVPRYCIGLSATPYRMDGLNVLFEAYFGAVKEGKEKLLEPEKSTTCAVITRQLNRKHLVYFFHTEFKPEVKLNRMGRVDWGSILEQQTTDEDRNELIIKVLRFFSKRIFLVLCKRVFQAEYLVKRLMDEKESVTSLIGSNQTYDKKARILVGTTGKCSTGFDDPRLDALMLASDMDQYFVQVLGRIFRRQDVDPIVIDFVDNYSLLQKHYRNSKKVYLDHGGELKNLAKEFPEEFGEGSKNPHLPDEEDEIISLPL